MTKPIPTIWVIRLRMLLPALLLAFSLQAQSISDYQVTPTITFLDDMAGDSALLQGNFDDSRVQGVRIGFAFPFDNQVFRTLSVSANGFIKLGTTPIVSNGYAGGIDYTGVILAAPNDDYTIAAMASDLIGHANIGRLAIKRFGAAPNRSVTIRWSNMRRFINGSITNRKLDTLTYQISLFENGEIELTYGRMFALGSIIPRGAQAGLRGLGLSNVLAMSGNFFMTATASNNPNATLRFDSLAMPIDGFTYRFTPTATSDLDLKAEAVRVQADVRSGCALSAQEPVVVEVRNRGTQAAQQATVGLVVDGIAAQPLSVTFSPALQPNESRPVLLSGASGANLTAFGLHRLRGYVSMPGDTALQNDTVRTAITVRAPMPVANMPILTSLADLQQWEWLQGTANANAPADSANNVWAGTNFNYPNSIVYAVTAQSSALGQYPWLYRRALSTQAPVALRFKLAVASMNGNQPVPTVGDDTLKVRYTTDCGVTWRTAARYSNADLANGTINNVLKSFVVPLAGANGPFGIGFQVIDSRTAPQASYRWILDDIEVRDTSSFSNDLATDQVSLLGTTNSGCARSANEVLKVTVRNNGLQPITQATLTLRVNGVNAAPTIVTFTPALASGQSRVVDAPGANLSQFGGYIVQAIVRASADNSPFNDTASTGFVLQPPVDVPGPTPVVTLADAQTKGWLQSELGQFAPGATVNNAWTTAVTFLPESFYYRMDGFQGAQYGWLYRPGVRTNGATGLRFKLAALTDQGNPVPAALMQDDTMKVMISDNCGVSWRPVARFTVDDVTSGRVDNTLKTFIVPFAQAPGTFSVGFQLDNNRTLAPGPAYRWYLDDLEFVTGTNLSADSVLQPGVVASFCPNRPLGVSVRVTNRGVSAMDSVVLGMQYLGGPVYRQVFRTRLVSGQTDTFTFSPGVIPGPGRSGFIRFKVFTITANDQEAANDTLSLSTLIPPPQPLIGGTLAGLPQLTSAGYYQARTWNEMPDRNVFYTSTAFGQASPTVAYTLNPANGAGTVGWIISPTYLYGAGIQVVFQAAVTAGTAGTLLEAELGSDSLQLMYRLRCSEWVRMRSLSQTDLTAGELSNTLLEFVEILPPAAGTDTIQFAFRVSRGATAAPRPYTWHIRQISVGNYVANRPQLATQMRLYPNPAQDRVTVTFGKALTSARLTVRDLSGRVLAAATATGTETSLNLKGLAPGMYRMTVETPDGTITQPFTLQ